MSTTARMIVAGALAVALGAAGIGVIDGSGGGGLVAPAAADEQLPPFDGCANLRDWYVEQALPHVTAWGLNTPANYGANVMQARGETGEPVGSSATGTNVQEAGVDEPDIAKSNGDVAVTLRGRDLVVTDVSGAEPTEVGRVPVPGAWHGDVLLIGDRAVVTTSTTGYFPMGDMIRPAPADATMAVVDLSDPSNPALESVRRIDGDIVSAREHDGVVRIAISTAPTFGFVYPGRGRTAAEARIENRAIVRGSSVADWLPSERLGGVRTPLVDCADVRHPTSAAGIGTVTVLTMDPANPSAIDATAVAADGSMVYASTDRLYVATTDGGWSWMRRDRADGPSTDIHAFATDGADTTYVASGTIPGYVPDRWAFSEYEDVLRVAAEQGNGWNPRETVVSTLEENGSSLDVVGSVGGIGEREQIKAVRWFEDVAVVVTFRQTDPLYTLDLSESARPRIAGVLKILGYSAYLHPIGDSRLIGVGQDADARGVERGLQVSTFDLEELSRPTQVAKLKLGDRWAYSPLEYDSRAFTYLPHERLMFVPASGDGDGPRIEVIRVGRSGELHRYETIALRAPTETVRTLPVDDERVAVVSAGRVIRIVDVG